MKASRQMRESATEAHRTWRFEGLDVGIQPDFRPHMTRLKGDVAPALN
jgi:hypothetical protein